MIPRLLCTLLLVVAATASEARSSDPVAEARRAADLVLDAAKKLSAARTAENQLAAYGKAVLAYEIGLSALRSGLRALTVRMSEISGQLDGREQSLGDFLGVLQVIETSPPPVRLLHPSGPLGAARAGLLMAELSPELEAEVIMLKSYFGQVATIRAEQERAYAVLREGLSGSQSARIALANALENRVVTRTQADADAKVLRDDSVSLRAFADALSHLPVSAPGDLAFSAARGALPLPVAGWLLRRFGEPDAAGLSRPGIILEAPAHSLVTSPWQATIRYVGDFLDYGLIAMLEPEPGYLLVLSGLGEIHRNTGEVVSAGEPIGVMPGATVKDEEFLTVATEGDEVIRTETLYMELRENGEPVDPTPWFAPGLQKEVQR